MSSFAFTLVRHLAVRRLSDSGRHLQHVVQGTRLSSYPRTRQLFSIAIQPHKLLYDRLSSLSTTNRIHTYSRLSALCVATTVKSFSSQPRRKRIPNKNAIHHHDHHRKDRVRTSATSTSTSTTSASMNVSGILRDIDNAKSLDTLRVVCRNAQHVIGRAIAGEERYDVLTQTWLSLVQQCSRVVTKDGSVVHPARFAAQLLGGDLAYDTYMWNHLLAVTATEIFDGKLLGSLLLRMKESNATPDEGTFEILFAHAAPCQIDTTLMVGISQEIFERKMVTTELLQSMIAYFTESEQVDQLDRLWSIYTSCAVYMMTDGRTMLEKVGENPQLRRVYMRKRPLIAQQPYAEEFLKETPPLDTLEAFATAFVATNDQIQGFELFSMIHHLLHISSPTHMLAIRLAQLAIKHPSPIIRTAGSELQHLLEQEQALEGVVVTQSHGQSAESAESDRISSDATIQAYTVILEALQQVAIKSDKTVVSALLPNSESDPKK
jgi:hypothetical protein